MSSKVPVTIEPANVVLFVNSGISVADAIIAAGLPFLIPCGGRGTCGGCAVKVVVGALSPPDEIEQSKLLRAPQGIRLACRARVSGPVTIRLHTLPTRVPSQPPRTSASTASVLAVDLGTTTVKVALAPKSPGSPYATAAVPNRQSRFGADVLTRVSAAHHGHTDALRLEIQKSVSEAFHSLAGTESGMGENIERVVVVGNPVMISLYCGQESTSIDPSRPKQELTSALAMLSHGVDIPCVAFASEADTILIQGAAGHVGGDLLAGLLMLDPTPSEPFIYVDIGTNSEIAVNDRTHIHVASVPAGPVFEGAGISSGGSFGPGAVTKVWLKDGGIHAEVEGKLDPDRLCGSGLISLIASLRASGHIDESGRMWASGPLSDHFTDVDGQSVFSLVPTGAGPQLTQMDVRAFQAAKAALLAAIRIMLSASDEKPTRLVVSGSFGGAVSADELQALGIVPSDLCQVDIIGDAALLGALQVAWVPQTIHRIDALRSSAKHHELPKVDEFSAQYISAMRLSPAAGY